MLPQGFYKNLTNQEYHTGQGAFAESKSSLSNILDSPRKFKHEKSQPELDVFDGKAVKFNDGTALHTYFGEPEKFDKEITVFKPRKGEGSVALNKDIRQTIRDSKLTPIKADVLVMLKNFTVLLLSGEHEEARKVIEHPDRIVEQSGFFQHPQTGLWLKIRPDSIIPTDVAIWDLKKHTTPTGFKKQAMFLHYDLQAYMCLLGCSILTGVEHTDFGFIVFHAQEKPYDIEIVRADYDFIESGRRKFVKATQTLKDCLDSDKWPGKYKDEVGTISPTSYRLRQLETEIYD